MPNTTYGTPYVQSSDLVSAYPGTSSTLATRVDDISIKGNGINARTASYTLVLTDAGKNITMTVAGANTLGVPTNASVAYPTGTAIGVINLGAGSCTITPSGGVTVAGASLVLAQNEAAQLIKTGTDTWICLKGGGLPKASVSATTGAPTVTTVGSQTCYQFTGSGSFTLSAEGIFTALLVGGGGGGGGSRGGGGGSGGVISGTYYLAVGTYNIVVGAGGAGGATTSGGYPGANGNASTIASGRIVGIGGGAGSGGVTGGGGGSIGFAGGSGGGGAFTGTTTGGTGVAGQGNNGGNGQAGTNNPGGGGGGPGSAGTNATSTVAGGGGIGVLNSITGSAQGYGGGGGGGSQGGTAGAGGSSVGGNGTNNDAAAGAGLVNRGGGGGGGGITSSGGAGGAGGSGIVILLIG